MKSMLSIGIAVAIAAPAFAGVPMPTFQINTPGDAWDAANEGLLDNPTDLGDGTLQYSGTWTNAAGGWMMSYTFFQTATSFIVDDLNVMNTSGGILEVEALVNAPVTPTGPFTLMSGSIAGTLQAKDGPGDIATLTVPTGDHLYTAFIDGAEVRTLGDAPFSASATFPVQTNIGPLSFLNEFGPNAATDIGMRVRFDLSEGDGAQAQYSFVIESSPVPAPGAAALLLGAGFLARRRRA